MKEIKAYIKRERVESTVAALQEAGAPGITIVEIHPVGYGYEPVYFGLARPNVIQEYSYLRIVKLEVVCGDAKVERCIEAIRKCCCTGHQGDGRIFVTDVVTAVRIRDGARGEEAL